MVTLHVLPVFLKVFTPNHLMFTELYGSLHIQTYETSVMSQNSEHGLEMLNFVWRFGKSDQTAMDSIKLYKVLQVVVLYEVFEVNQVYGWIDDLLGVKGSALEKVVEAVLVSTQGSLVGEYRTRILWYLCDNSIRKWSFRLRECWKRCSGHDW